MWRLVHTGIKRTRAPTYLPQKVTCRSNRPLAFVPKAPGRTLTFNLSPRVQLWVQPLYTATHPSSSPWSRWTTCSSIQSRRPDLLCMALVTRFGEFCTVSLLSMKAVDYQPLGVVTSVCYFYLITLLIAKISHLIHTLELAWSIDLAKARSSKPPCAVWYSCLSVDICNQNVRKSVLQLEVQWLQLNSGISIICMPPL